MYKIKKLDKNNFRVKLISKIIFSFLEKKETQNYMFDFF